MTAAARRVLLVDDEPVVTTALGTYLRRRGHSVGCVTSAEEALARLEAGERFDVLLVDKNLPGMNGIELVRRVRTIQPELPAVLMTGYPSVQSSREADAAGAGAYLIKPFKSLEALRETIEHVTPARVDDRLTKVAESLQEVTSRLRKMNARLGDKS